MSLRLKIPNSGLLSTTREGKGLRLDLHRVVVCAGRLGDARSLEGEGAGDGPAGGRNLKFNRQDGGKQQRLGKGRGDLEPPPEAWGETDGLSLLPSMASLLLEGGGILPLGMFFHFGIVIILVHQRVGKLSHRGPELAGHQLCKS